ADTLASLEYYLEALREHRGSRQDILDIARSSLETLGYWPLPAEVEPEQAPVPGAAGAEAEAAPVPAGDEPAEAGDTAATVAAFIDRTPAVAGEGAGGEGADAPPQAAEAAAPAPVGASGGFEATGD